MMSTPSAEIAIPQDTWRALAPGVQTAILGVFFAFEHQPRVLDTFNRLFLSRTPLAYVHTGILCAKPELALAFLERLEEVFGLPSSAREQLGVRVLEAIAEPGDVR
jgi:O-antigen ligase